MDHGLLKGGTREQPVAPLETFDRFGRGYFTISVPSIYMIGELFVALADERMTEYVPGELITVPVPPTTAVVLQLG